MSFRPPLPPEEQPSGRGCFSDLIKPGAFITAIAVIITLLIRYGCQDPCEEVLKSLIAIEAIPKSDKSKGIGGSYTTMSDSVIVDLLEYDSSDKERFFESVVAPLVESLTLKAANQLPVNKDTLLEYQRQALKRGELMNEEKYVNNIITINPDIPPFELTVNELCKLTYKINVKYQDDLSDALPSEMKTYLDEIIKDCPEFNEFRAAPALKNIDFSKLLDCIKEREDSLIRIRKKYEPLFDMVNFGIPWLDKNGGVRFNPGDYKISGVDQLFIEAVIHEYEELIRANPESQFTISCLGYTDPTDPNGILYEGVGKYSEESTEIFVDGSNGIPIPRSFSSNTQLAYARAFSGAKYLSERMQLFRLPRYKVSIVYKGEGVDFNSNKSYQERRRIEFSISISDK